MMKTCFQFIPPKSQRSSENQLPDDLWFYRNETGNLVDTAADTAVIAEVHPHEEGFSDDKFVVHKTPVAGVGTVVAVVAHGEVTAFGHFAGKATAVFGVLTVFQTALLYGITVFRHDFHTVFIERRDRYGGLSGFFQDVEAFSVEGRLKKFGAVNRGRLGIVRVGISAVRLVGGNLSVDGQDFVAVFDGIARQSDDALDVVHFRLDGIVEHDDVAALDLSGRNQDAVDNRGSDAVGEFVYKDEVAFNQAGTHGAGRDLEWLGDKGAQDEDDEDDREKAAHVVGKVGFVLMRRVFFQTTFVDCPNDAGEYDKYQQYGGKAHVKRQDAENADHAQKIRPLQAGTPFSVFLTFFAAYEIKENADNDGGNRAVD